MTAPKRLNKHETDPVRINDAIRKLQEMYEEGTWTPTLTTNGTDFTSVTYDAITGGRYVRYGQLVHIQGTLRTDAVTVGAATGTVFVGGLPFESVAATGSTNDSRFVIPIGSCSGWAGEEPLGMNSVGSTLFLFYRAAVDGDTVATAIADVATGADGNFMRFGGTYICTPQ